MNDVKFYKTVFRYLFVQCTTCAWECQRGPLNGNRIEGFPHLEATDCGPTLCFSGLGKVKVVSTVVRGATAASEKSGRRLKRTKWLLVTDLCCD